MFLLKKTSKEIINKLFSSENEEKTPAFLTKIEQTLSKYRDAGEKIQAISPKNSCFTLFFLDFREIQEKMLKKTDKIVSLCLNRLTSLFQRVVEKMHADYKVFSRKLATIPQNEQEIMELRGLLEKKREFLTNVDQKTRFLDAILDLFQRFFFEIPVIYRYFFAKFLINK